MTDPQLRIEVAKRLGLNVVGMAHCWAPDGPPWSVLRDDQSHEGHDYSPVYLVDEDDRTGSDLLGFACGHPATDLLRVADYPGDPREFVRLLDQMAAAPNVGSVLTESAVLDGVARHVVNIIPERPHPKIRPSHAPTLGRAVCLAWSAWHDAAGGEGE